MGRKIIDTERRGVPPLYYRRALIAAIAVVVLAVAVAIYLHGAAPPVHAHAFVAVPTGRVFS